MLGWIRVIGCYVCFICWAEYANHLHALQARIAEPSSTTRSTPEAAVIASRSIGSASLPSVCTPAVDANAKCRCGRPWQDAAVVPATRAGVQSYCFHMTTVHPVTVNKRECACKEVLQYDGIEAAILNLDNVHLFSHEVLKWSAEFPCCHAARYLFPHRPNFGAAARLAIAGTASQSCVVALPWRTLMDIYGTIPGIDPVSQKLANKVASMYALLPRHFVGRSTVHAN